MASFEQDIRRKNDFPQVQAPKSRFKASQYVICILNDGGHRRIFSPDFGIHFAVPVGSDPHKWTALTLQQMEVEIESRLKKLDAQNLPHPTPQKWPEIFPKVPSDLIGIRDVAKLMGVSQDTVRRLSGSGKLKAHTTPGGHRRFSKAEIEKYLHDSCEIG